MPGELQSPPPTNNHTPVRTLRLVAEVELSPGDRPTKYEAAAIVTDALGSAALRDVEESIRVVTYGRGDHPLDGTLMMPFPQDDGSRTPWRISESDQGVAAHFGLTPREMQVLGCLPRGLTNAQIGRELYLSEDTVKTHLRKAYAKLNARDRAHAVGIVNGIVPQPPKRIQPPKRPKKQPASDFPEIPDYSAIDLDK